MDYNFSQHFRIQKYCLNILGLNALDEKWPIRGILQLMAPLVGVVGVCFGILHYVFLHWEDIEEMTNSLVVFWVALTSIFKLLTYLLKYEAMKRLAVELKTLNDKGLN